MNRRTTLAATGTLLSVSVAGCLFEQAESEPRFTLRDVRSHLADAGTAVVVGTVTKQGSDAGEVTIRAELLIEDDYDHASVQTFVIPADIDERVVALPFTSDSDFYGERTFAARAKIVRDGAGDGAWITETE